MWCMERWKYDGCNVSSKVIKKTDRNFIFYTFEGIIYKMQKTYLILIQK